MSALPPALVLVHTQPDPLSQMGLLLEMELGVTGGEEDGVDNSGVAKEDLYSKPEEIYDVYEALNPIAPKASVDDNLDHVQICVMDLSHGDEPLLKNEHCAGFYLESLFLASYK